MHRFGDVGIYQHRYFAHAGNCLDENFLPFPVEFRRKKTNPRNVATGPGEGSYKPVRDHILGHSDQRYSSRRQRQRSQRQLGASDNYIGRCRDERRYDARDLIVGHAETSWDNDQVLTFNETVQTKLVKHCNDGWRVSGRRKEETDTIGTTGVLRAPLATTSLRRREVQ